MAIKEMVLSMSFKRGDAKKKIEDKAYPTFAWHVAYLCMYKEALATNHWKNELISPLAQFRLWTNIKGGKISDSDLLNWLYVKPLTGGDTFLQLKKDCIKHMNGAKPDVKLTPILLETTYKKLINLVLSKTVISVTEITKCFNP